MLFLANDGNHFNRESNRRLKIVDLTRNSRSLCFRRKMLHAKQFENTCGV